MSGQAEPQTVTALPVVRQPELRAGGAIRAIVPQSMEEAYRLAVAICKAGLMPKGFDGPEGVMIAILHGLEVGMTPMTAVQKIAVINGRPTIWGDGALGLVRGSGLCQYLKEWIAGDGDAAVAWCETHRKGEAAAIKRSFSVAEAKKAGLWGKAGPWQNYPARMLQMRARGFALRDTYADVLGGMYLAEELQGEEFFAGAPGARQVPEAPPAPPPAQIAAPTEQPLPTHIPPAPVVSRETVKDDMPDIPASLDRRPRKLRAKAAEKPVEPVPEPAPQDQPQEPVAISPDALAAWLAEKYTELKLCKTTADVEALREEVLDELSGTEPQSQEWRDATAERSAEVFRGR